MSDYQTGIVTKSDSNFFQGLDALIRSLEWSNPRVPIFVLDFGLEPRHRKVIEPRVTAIVPMKARYKPRVHSVVGTHYNSTIFALMEFSALPVERIVHLDADCLVLDSIEELTNPLTERDFVGVADFPALTLRDHLGGDEDLRLTRCLLGLRDSDFSREAFNAGVFSVTRKIYDEMLPKMELLYESKLALPRRDQTLLNLALTSNEVCCAPALPVTYNFRPFFRRSPETTWDGTVLVDGLNVPVYQGERVRIAHAIGFPKPWMSSFEREDAKALWAQFARGDV